MSRLRYLHVIILVLVAFLFCGCDSVCKDSPMEYRTLFAMKNNYPSEKLEKICPSGDEIIPALSIPSGSYIERFDMNDGSDYLDYYLFIPENAVENMPLIIFLHGIGEVGQVDLLEDHGMIKKAKEIYGDSFPFIALSPCTNTTSWTKYAVPDTLKALIDDIAVKCKIDPDRIIITGHSLGAIGTWNMVSLYGDFFSAAVPISCGIDQPMDYANCANVPIWAFAGTVGEYEVNYNNAMHHIVDRIVSYGGNVRITVLSGADHEMTLLAPYTPELFQWMLEQ